MNQSTDTSAQAQPPTPEQKAEVKRIHREWQEADRDLALAREGLDEATALLEDATTREATASKAYLDFVEAYWATRGPE